MGKGQIALTREELYTQVWSEPIVHVAARLGMSGRGLGKMCARYRIPVPPRGWWAKKQHGYRVRQTPLPEVTAKEQIVFERGEPVERTEDPPEIGREKTAEWRIEVPDELTISHPLVKRTAAAIRKASREVPKNRVVRWQDRYQAKLLKPGPGNLDVAVSKASLARALRILQALLAGFDRRGFGVQITDKNETFVTVILGGRVKCRNLLTAQMPHFQAAAETGEFYFAGGSARKSAATFVRQLRGPHLRTCA